ncbi:MAG: hypothetical protein IT285_13865 [Bdellovibrionales bacterium]|nr:hypothetical protein [Bdellovibrionales bacterium]
MRSAWALAVGVLAAGVAAMPPEARAESSADTPTTGVSTQAIQLPKPAGTIKGFGGEAESVGNTGAASYSVEIEVPKGRNNLQPALALQYNSTGGQGVLGFGWSLSLPKIERAQTRGVPRFTLEDLFMAPDGELILTSAPGAPGQASFRPLMDRGQVHLVFDQTTDRWTRFEANGLIHVFGAVPESRVAGKGGTQAWWLTETRDPFGNRLTYHYIEDGGHAYPVECRYVFADAQPDSHLYEIEFQYEDRPDPIVSFPGSLRLSMAKRLSQVEVRTTQSGGTLLRRYRMSYDETATGGLTRLRKVELIGDDGTSKFPDLEFDYSEEPAFTGRTSKVVTFDASGSPQLPPSVHNPRVSLIDLNGDALTDILETRADGAAVWMGNGDGTFEASTRLPRIRSTLGGKNLKLLDVTGDRQVDLVGSGLYPKFWTGDGEGGFDPAPQDLTNFPFYSIAASQVKTFDVNGDGRMDITVQLADRQITQLMGEDGRLEEERIIFPGGAGSFYPFFSFHSPRTFFVDMNGDGLTDIVYPADNELHTIPNRGDGTWDPLVTLRFDEVNYPVDCPSQGNCPKPALIMEYATRLKQLLVTDLNSDGLPDLLVPMPNAIAFAFNRAGLGFGPTQVIDGIHPEPLAQEQVRVTQADMNGNGSLDVVWSNARGDWRYFDFLGELGSEPKSNLLVQVRDKLGKRTEIEYQPHTQYPNHAELLPQEQTRIPYAVHAVKRIAVFAWDEPVSETQFSYFGGFYEGPRNEFRGFRLIERYQPGDASVPDVLERRWFELGRTAATDLQRGQLLKKEIRRTVLDRSRTHWEVRDVGAVMQAEDMAYLTLATDTGSLAGRGDPSLILEAQKLQTEGDETGASRAYAQDMSYALENGAIRTKTTLTQDDLGADYRREIETYAHGVDLPAGLWNVSNVAVKEIRTPGNALVQSTRFFYDDLTVLGAVTQGKITHQDRWDSTAFGGAGAFVTKNSYGWTAEGNLAFFEDAAGPIHRTNITYSAPFFVFPSTVTNPAGHVQQVVYDLMRGVITESRDENLNFSRYEYDPFLRLDTVTGPEKNTADLDPAHPTMGVTYTFGDDTGVPSTILTQKREDLAPGVFGTLDSKAYFDPIGRSLGTILEGPTAKFIHTGGARYNVRGKVERKYLPFFVNGMNDFALNESRPFIRTEFDELDRPLAIYNPEHTESGPSVKVFQYRVGETTITDEKGNNTFNRFDFLGRLVEIENAQGHKTTYGYTLTDQLALIADAKMELTHFEYDSLDRRTCKLDPNLGKTTYQFNDLDLLTSKSDFGWEAAVDSCADLNANVPRIMTYQYSDPLNRITFQDSADPETAPVMYAYDAGVDGKGRLTGTTFEIGSKSFQYDRFGNVTQTSYVVDGQSATVQEQFDVLGRLRRVVYPVVSGNVLTVGYEYDEAGNVRRVFNEATGLSYANNLTYNELNQLTRLDFGNGIKTRMRYDIAQGSYRLQDLLTYEGTAIPDTVPLATACTASALQCLGYTYDQVSNITEIGDLKSASFPVREFQYDELNQLTSATGQWGTQAWTYDEIGNITQKVTTPPLAVRTGLEWVDEKLGKAASSGWVPFADRVVENYTYHPERKQILTQVGSVSYGFNRDGNLATRGNNQDLFWDARNELKRFKKGNNNARYYYDENGERVRKEGNQGTPTRWFGRYLERPQSGFIKRYVYVGSKRIAIVPENGNNVRYIHGDHLQSTNYVTDKDANVERHLEYATYGEVVQDQGGFGQFRYDFTDKYRDQESDSQLRGERYYSPTIGKWLSADPLHADEVRPLIKRSFAIGSAQPGRFKFNGQVSAGSERSVRDQRSNIFNRYSEREVDAAEGGKPAFNPVGTYAYAGNSPVVFFDLGGNKIDWNGFAPANPAVRENFEKLNDNIIRQNLPAANPDNFTLKVSGGDRYLDSKGNEVSATNHQVVVPAEKRQGGGPHLIESGARAIDFTVSGATESQIREGVKGTGFQQGQLITPDKYPQSPHYHLGLPSKPEYMLQQPTRTP